VTADPFAVVEPGFERWQGPQCDLDFSQPDLTARSLKDWLRSDEVTTALDKLQPPAKLTPNRSHQRLAHIPSFPG
jgi:hypothetical protein